MTVYNDLISILFQLPDGRNLEEYFKNILLLSKFSDSDLETGVSFPESGIKKYSTYDEVIADFKATSQTAIEAYGMFSQKNNSQTTSQLKYLIIAKQNSNDTITEALDNAKSVDGRFAKVVPVSRTAEDIQAVASWCMINDRFCDFVVTSVANVENIVNTENNYAY